MTEKVMALEQEFNRRNLYCSLENEDGKSYWRFKDGLNIKPNATMGDVLDQLLSSQDYEKTVWLLFRLADNKNRHGMASSIVNECAPIFDKYYPDSKIKSASFDFCYRSNLSREFLAERVRNEANEYMVRKAKIDFMTHRPDGVAKAAADAIYFAMMSCADAGDHRMSHPLMFMRALSYTQVAMTVGDAKGARHYESFIRLLSDTSALFIRTQKAR